MNHSNKPNYKETLCLPATSFPMRAELVKRESEMLAYWEKEGTYQKILKQKRAKKSKKFLLHDGPPFANGDVHMGTALNKVLKDLVVKSKTMAGFEVPFVPGWDCHGLPIEYKVSQQAQGLAPTELRKRCADFAQGWIDTQRQSFKRLGVWGEWDKPYLTMRPAYEADILRLFANLVEKGLVYQSQRPVLWSFGAGTALAEAEIDYQQKASQAIFVTFPLKEKFKETKAQLVIWTTTPWTLPANLGVAVHPEFDYLLAKFKNSEGEIRQLIVAKKLQVGFSKQTDWVMMEIVTIFKGKNLEGKLARHPFLERDSKVVLADFVTAESGSGCVHIAPGHGLDDYIVGQKNQLGILSPVDEAGKFTADCELSNLVGRHVLSCQKDIIQLLGENGSLIAQHSHIHQYPYCWRSKTPVIYRSVKQFFISVNALKEESLKEIQKVKWMPQWGKTRLSDTIEARPDWCISRQRSWGVPLPVFFTPEGEPIIDATLISRVADRIEKEEEGSDFWFNRSPQELATEFGLPKGSYAGRDTLDVWIDSGSSQKSCFSKAASARYSR